MVLAPAYPTLHKYAHSTSETSCVSTVNVHGASAKYWYQHQHIQHYTNTPTALQKLHVRPFGMCMVLVPNIGNSTSISNTTQIRSQNFRNFMCVHWECAWCQCQILVLAPAYPTLHKYAHRPSETSCVSTVNVHGASAIYCYQYQHIQHYTNMHTELQKLHVFPLGMCVVLVPNIGISTSISNTTQIYPQNFRNFMCPLGMCVVLVPNIGISTSIFNTTQIRSQIFRNFMCVNCECAWCQCQILVLAPAYPTLHKYTHRTYEISCVSFRNVRGGSAKYWYQHEEIQLYTNALTDLQKLHVCQLGLCVVLVPNCGISTSISNTTHIRPQNFRNFMCVHQECAWCQYQIMVLAPACPTLHKYAHSTSETSCVSTVNVHGASAKYWYQHQHIQHYTNTPTALQKLHVFPLGMCVVLVPNIGISTSISNTTQICTQNFRNFMCFHWECAWCQCQILVLAPAYPTLHIYAHRPSETSCVSTGYVRGASAKYWYQHQHIQHQTDTPTELQKLHVCPLGMCVVLVPNIGISTSISNTTQIRSQIFRNFMCVNCECAWCYCQILVLAPAYPTLHKYTHRTYEISCVSFRNVRGASAKYWYQHEEIQLYTNALTVLQKLHVCQLGMCVVLVPNCGISTSISNTTHIRPQHFRNFMCVHQECAWCQYQIMVLAPAYPTLLKYAHRSSETSCVSTVNVHGASAKYWY